MRLYHGGRPGLKVGDRLQVPAFYTSSLAIAAFYAASHPNGALYEVRICCELIPDRERPRHRRRALAGTVRIADVISPRVPWASTATALRAVIATTAAGGRS